MHSAGFWVGWSNFSSTPPAIIILGEAASQTVVCLVSPCQLAVAPALTPYQHGSCW